MRRLKAPLRTEEETMRFFIFAAIVALAGCTSTTERAQAPQQQAGRAVAFYSNDNAEYREAAQRADEWCHETYDSPAKYLSQRNGSGGNIVTFRCATN